MRPGSEAKELVHETAPCTTLIPGEPSPGTFFGSTLKASSERRQDGPRDRHRRTHAALCPPHVAPPLCTPLVAATVAIAAAAAPPALTGGGNAKAERARMSADLETLRVKLMRYADLFAIDLADAAAAFSETARDAGSSHPGRQLAALLHPDHVAHGV